MRSIMSMIKRNRDKQPRFTHNDVNCGLRKGATLTPYLLEHLSMLKQVTM